MNTKDKHILIVTSEFPPQPGGIGNHAYHVARSLTHSGYQVSVITDQRSESGADETYFDSSLAFNVYRVAIQNPRLLMYVTRLFQLFRHMNSVDIVLASGKFSLWSVALVSFFYKKKFLAVIHGTEVNFKNSILKHSINKSLKRYAHVITVSQYTKGLVGMLKLSSVSVIPNGIDYVKWSQQIQLNSLLNGEPKIITVGHVSERKGQLQVIKQLPELIKHYPDIHYHCVGIPTKKDVFFAEARRLNVASYVTFHGQVTDDELKNFISDSDIFIMLSTETKSGDVEGFGIAIIEANALGVPAIGSGNSGIQDAIFNRHSGIIVDDSDTNGFTEAINTILGSKDFYSKEARAWAKKHDWSVIINRYIKIIEA